MNTRKRRYIIILAIAVLYVFATNAFGQNVAINPGVDSTDKDIKTVITLWTNYLESKPSKEKIKDSPFWADTEKKKFPKVDQLLNAINTEVPTYLMGRPTILYVKPNHDYFEIKTLIGWTDSLKSVYTLCIASVFAKKEKEQFKLYNALTINSKSWKTKKLGSVTFHYLPTHSFDKNNANKLLQSIDRLTKQWNLQIIPIDYYFADTYEEIQHLRGLDYSIGMGNKDKPSGMSDFDAKTVFAGGLGENYFHEMVHIYLNRLFPNSPLTEGLAVFYGGSLGHDLKWHLTRLDEYLHQHSEINLSELDKFWFMDNFTNPNSSIQGLLCTIAFKKGGLDKLKNLMSQENTYVAIEKELGVKRDGLNQYLRKQISEYKN